MTKTFYEVLGVSPDATTEEIRTAYRDRLKEAHPDLNDDEDANATTRRIVRARDVLTDEDERQRYDRVGHDEFVGNDDSPVDESDVSNAATAARRAGWGGESGDDEPKDDNSADDTAAGQSRAGGRRRARERRRRERAAQDRVRNERTYNVSGGREQTETTSTDGGPTTTSSTGGPTATSTSGGISESARAWNASSGYSVRQDFDTGNKRSKLHLARQYSTLITVTFVLYPVMLFSALFPPFPLIVNVVVGLCTIFLVGYLQSIPEVGIAVFGVWSFLTPIAFIIAGIPLTGLIGIIALTGTWLPFGLSVLILSLVHP